MASSSSDQHILHSNKLLAQIDIQIKYVNLIKLKFKLDNLYFLNLRKRRRKLNLKLNSL